MRLVEVAFRGEEKCVARERLRQQGSGDLALLLEDDVVQRATVDGLRNGRAQHGICERPGIGDFECEQRDRRREGEGEALLLRLANLLGGDFDQIGAAHAEVEPLIAHGAMNAYLDGVDKRPALPAGVTRGEREHAIAEAGDGEGSCARVAGGRFAVGGDGERDEELVVCKQRRQVGHGVVAGEDDRRADSADRSPRAVRWAGRVERGDDGDGRQRRAVVKMHAGAQAELPAMIAAVGVPLRSKRGADDAVVVEDGEAIENEAAGDAIGPLPGLAFDLHAQRAAVMRPRAGYSRHSQRCKQQTNCKSP